MGASTATRGHEWSTNDSFWLVVYYCSQISFWNNPIPDRPRTGITTNITTHQGENDFSTSRSEKMYPLNGFCVPFLYVFVTMGVGLSWCFHPKLKLLLKFARKKPMRLESTRFFSQRSAMVESNHLKLANCKVRWCRIVFFYGKDLRFFSH